MKLSANSVKPEGTNTAQMAYSQTAGFPTIAPAPQQATLAQGHHQGIMSTHQGQFQVISSPPFATSATPQNTAQYSIPQFATYNQQGQLVLSPANFPGSPYGGQQQIILTTATGMQQQQQQQQQQPQQQQQGQGNQQGAPQAQGQNKAPGALLGAGKQGGSATIMSQPGGYTLTHNGLVPSNSPGGPTFMFANTSPLMASSQTVLEAPKSEANKTGGNQLAQSSTQAAPGSLIMHNGMAYMNPQHQQAILSSNGQIILRAHETGQQQIMFSPSPIATQQSHISAAQNGANNNQNQLQTSTAQQNLAPPTLQPMSNPGIRQVSAASVVAPPGKTPISRALPPILPTTRPTYTLPQTPVSQASLAQVPSPKSKNKFSPRAPPPKINNSILKPAQHLISTPQSPRGPPILSQQQPPVNSQSSQQPPTLQPMHTVVSSSQALQYPPVLAAATSSGITKTLTTTKNTLAKTSAPLKAKSTPTPPPEPPTNDTPKAFVKPNVLTHVIDGHIIQESSSPFPLESPLEDDKGRGRASKKEEDAPNVSTSSGSGALQASTTTTTTAKSTTHSSTTNSGSNNNGLTSSGHAEKKRGPGRPPGSTRQNIDSQRIPGSEVTPSSKGSNHIKDGPPNEKRRKLEEPILKPVAPQNPVFGKNGNPLKWTVQQVCDFVKSLHGCAEYVEDFMLQEIDGQALMLLKTEHLMAAMSIKLGPALKICSAINEMREEVKQV